MDHVFKQQTNRLKNKADRLEGWKIFVSVRFRIYELGKIFLSTFKCLKFKSRLTNRFYEHVKVARLKSSRVAIWK